MSKALDRTVASEAAQSRDWRKGMSDTVAYSLLAYTGLHIFVTVGAIQETGAKSLAMTDCCAPPTTSRAGMSAALGSNFSSNQTPTAATRAAAVNAT